MSLPGRPLVPTALLLIVFICPAASPALAQTEEGQSSDSARESTYPAQVANITQDPWNVRKGQDVRVTLELHEEAETPDRVSMIWCRVEPDYVCALPLLMTPDGQGGWSATIPGASGGREDVVQEETRHIGYNISLQYATAEGNGTHRVWAPTHNTWTPVTFPQDTVGEYYFIKLQDTAGAPAALAPILLSLLSTLLLGLRRFKNPRHDTHGQTMEEAQ